MDVISRLPPPGGTTAIDIFRSVLITSYNLSVYLAKDFHNISSSYLQVDIVFDADYETVLGENVVEFQTFLLWHLKRLFRRCNGDIDKLTIKKGSIGVTYFINLLKCVHSKKLNNRCWFSETERFKKKEEKIYVNRQTEMNYFEREFVNFLKYLDYHLSFKQDNAAQKSVPFSVKTSIFKNPEQWDKKLNLLDTEIESNLFSDGEEFLTGIMTSMLPYRDEMEQRTSNWHTNSLKKDVNKKSDTHIADFLVQPVNDLNYKRIRRYVAQEEETKMKLKVKFTFEKPTKNGDSKEFQQHLVSQLAKEMRVPVPSINDMKIMSDTDVSFTLSAFNDKNNVMDDISIIEAADSLKTKIRSQQLRLQDLNGQLLMTAQRAYASVDEVSSGYSFAVLVILGITLLVLTILILTIIYIARKMSRTPVKSTKRRTEIYKDFQNFGRDSSQSIGKYSYDSGLWLGPGPEPNFSVPDAPYYRPPTVEQISSTPRPITAVRTRLKRNWNVDERALSTIPDDYGRNYIAQETPFSR